MRRGRWGRGGGGRGRGERLFHPQRTVLAAGKCKQNVVKQTDTHTHTHTYTHTHTHAHTHTPRHTVWVGHKHALIATTETHT